VNRAKHNDSESKTRQKTAIHTTPGKVKFALVVEYKTRKKLEHVVEYTNRIQHS
jgi:hypothetical protein